MDLHDEIAKVAYELFLKRGCVHGHDLDDWLEAERIVLARYQAQLKESEVMETEKLSPKEEKTETSSPAKGKRAARKRGSKKK
ncbi:MAG: DUF2934 domain-containing protein [Candidatus Aenigmatarchaeota archaeon]